MTTTNRREKTAALRHSHSLTHTPNMRQNDVRFFSIIYRRCWEQRSMTLCVCVCVCMWERNSASEGIRCLLLLIIYTERGHCACKAYYFAAAASMHSVLDSIVQCSLSFPFLRYYDAFLIECTLHNAVVHWMHWTIERNRAHAPNHVKYVSLAKKN